MNKGSSQGSRKNKTLNPNFVSIDERKLMDLVNFTLEYAQNIHFYSFQNKVGANWKSFLLNSPVFIIASIAATDTNTFKINEENLETQAAEKHGKENIREILKNIKDRIKHWSGLLSKTNYKGSLLNEIKNSIQTIDSKHVALTNTSSGEILKDIYEKSYGSMVFIKEQALKQFDNEIKRTNHHPHIGLLLAFFKLFNNLQQDINSITQKHLDFYFLELLKQQKKPLGPHTALIGLELQPGIENLVIGEGEKFELAYNGKQSVTFETISDTQINRAEIAEIKTLYKSDYHPFGQQFDDKSFFINILYESNILEPKTKLHEAYPATLGEKKQHSPFSKNVINQSEIGILISSPALILEKGKQNIQISFKITPSSYDQSKNMFDELLLQELKQQNKDNNDSEKSRQKIVSQFFNDAFLIYISGVEGWKQVNYSKTRINKENNSLDFEIPLPGEKNTLIPFNNKIHKGEFDTDWPCIKLMLNNDAQYYPYKILKNIVIEDINIKTLVSEVRDLILSNSAGNIETSIPFMPFGPAPVVGNYLRIQNPLILQKNLTHLEMKITWSGLPQLRNGFTNYYQAYPQSTDNKIFKAVITQSKNKLRSTGKTKQQEIELFEMDGEYLSNEKKITLKTDDYIFSPENMGSKNELDEKSSQLYMVLSSPETAFGHQIFTETYAKAALKMSRRKKTTGLLPRQPYIPVIERLEVSYTNTAREIMLRKLDENVTDIKFLHLYPFGHIQVYPGPVKSQSFLFPQIEHKGNLLIGLKNVKAAEIVSIGFDLVPAVYVHTVINVPEVQWEYLLNNEWEPLHGLVLEDTTSGLFHSGIVKIELPKSIQFENSRLPKGKFWIRAVFDGPEDVRSKIKNIFPHAVSLTSHSTFESKTQYPAANETIQKLTITGRKELSKLLGPFALELNERVETDDNFYSRVSDQLRHKNRVVSNWDVERIILDRFKQIDKVRAYGRSSHPKELVKGSNLQIVLIPKNKLKGETRIRSTKVSYSTLIEVQKYISQFVSPHVKVEVSNPVYEQLKIRCKVKFNDSQKSGYLKNTLNSELISYLSPDIENEFIEKGFDESISKTEILNFIESRPYVEFVTGFSVLQLVEVQGRYKIIDTAVIQKINDLRTISAYAILTSAPEHQISIIHNKKPAKSKISGIGDLSVEADFVISDGNGNYI